jgi:hypothetical protein
MEDLEEIISQGSGIPVPNLVLFTLLNEPSDDPQEYYFSREKHWSGWAQPVVGKQQLLWVVDKDGYKDLEVASK